MITKMNEKKKKTPYSLKSIVSSPGGNNLLGLIYEFPGPTPSVEIMIQKHHWALCVCLSLEGPHRELKYT